jgi:hypothetical protein
MIQGQPAMPINKFKKRKGERVKSETHVLFFLGFE